MCADRPSRRRDRLLRVFKHRSRSSSVPLHAGQTVQEDESSSTPLTVTGGDAALAARANDIPSVPANPIESISDQGAAVSIYEEALKALSDDDRELLGDHDGLDECIENVDLLLSICFRDKVKWQFRGKEKTLQSEADKIFTCLHNCKALGDTIAAAIPQAALPWAAVKTLLELAIANKKQREFLTQGLERALHCSYRLLVYVEELVKADICQAATNMRESLVKLNIMVLQFMAIAVRTIATTPVVRLIIPLWSLSAIEDFDKKCEQLMVIIDRDAASCGREAAALATDRITTQLEDVDLQLDLDKLNRTTAEGATHDSKVQSELSKCLAGTRAELLEVLQHWIHEDKENIFWLCGQAGTGKSTISRTLAGMIEASGYPVASFFFKRTEAKRSDARCFFSTITQQLVHQIKPLRRSVGKALQADAMITDKSLFEQFTDLVERPLRTAAISTDVFLVIDALDECVLQDVRGILKIFLSAGIPLKVFLTSRPEADIVKWFKEGKHQDFRLENILPCVAAHDIELFIKHEIGAYAQPDVISLLTSMTTPLFIAASTMCTYILEMDPEGTIQQLLCERKLLSSNMVDFYFVILQSIMQRLSKVGQQQYSKNFRSIVGTLAVLADPLDIPALVELLAIPEATITSLLRSLQSVITTEGRIRPLHLTFYEAVTQFDAPFDMKEDDAHSSLCRACLRFLDTNLKQDFFDLKHPGTRKAAVSVSMSGALSYACQYWARHMKSYEQLSWFLSTHLLHWLEAMSWLNKLAEALDSLAELAARQTDTNLRELVVDSRRLLQQNLHIIDIAPLQLYLSVLAYAPRLSTVSQLYRPVLDNNPYIDKLPAVRDSWDSRTWTVPYDVRAFAIDADRSRIAITDGKGEILVLALKTGITLLRWSDSNWPGDDRGLGNAITFINDHEVGAILGSHMVQLDLDTGRTTDPVWTGDGRLKDMSKDFAYSVRMDIDHSTERERYAGVYLFTHAKKLSRRLRYQLSRRRPYRSYASVTCTSLLTGIASNSPAKLFDNKTAECVFILDALPLNCTIVLSPDSAVLAVVPPALDRLYFVDLPQSADLKLAPQVCSITNPTAEFTTTTALSIFEVIEMEARQFLLMRTGLGSCQLIDLSTRESVQYHETGTEMHLMPLDWQCYISAGAESISYHESEADMPVENATNALLAIEQHQEVFCYRASSRMIAVVDHKAVHVYDDELRLVIVHPRSGKPEHFVRLWWSPDETHLMYVQTLSDRGGEDSEGYSLSVVTVPDGRSYGLSLVGEPRDITLSPDGQYCAWTCRDKVMCINIITGEPMFEYSTLCDTTHVVFTSDSCGLMHFDTIREFDDKHSIRLLTLQGKVVVSSRLREDLEDAAINDLRERARAQNCKIIVERQPRSQLILNLHQGWLRYGEHDVLYIPFAYRNEPWLFESTARTMLMLQTKQRLAFCVVKADLGRILENDVKMRAEVKFYKTSYPVNKVQLSDHPESTVDPGRYLARPGDNRGLLRYEEPWI